MDTFTSAVKTFVHDENGITAIEYGLIAALIAAGLVVSVGFVSGALTSAFNYIKDQVTAAIT